LLPQDREIELATTYELEKDARVQALMEILDMVDSKYYCGPAPVWGAGHSIGIGMRANESDGGRGSSLLL